MTYADSEKTLQFLKLQVQKRNLERYEVKYACDIISKLDLGKKFTDTTVYFDWLKSQELETHAKIANFAIRVFQVGGGAEYSLLGIKSTLGSF